MKLVSGNLPKKGFYILVRRFPCGDQNIKDPRKKIATIDGKPTAKPYVAPDTPQQMEAEAKDDGREGGAVGHLENKGGDDDDDDGRSDTFARQQSRGSGDEVVAEAKKKKKNARYPSNENNRHNSSSSSTGDSSSPRSTPRDRSGKAKAKLKAKAEGGGAQISSVSGLRSRLKGLKPKGGPLPQTTAPLPRRGPQKSSDNSSNSSSSSADNNSVSQSRFFSPWQKTVLMLVRIRVNRYVLLYELLPKCEYDNTYRTYSSPVMCTRYVSCQRC